MIGSGPIHAIDAWGLGVLTLEASSGKPMIAVEEFKQTDRIPVAMLSCYKRLLAVSSGVGLGLGFL